MARLHQLLKYEEEFLRPLHRKSGHNDAAATLDRLTNQRRQFRTRIVRGMLPVAIGGFHYQHIRYLAFSWAGAEHFPWIRITHSSNVSGEQQLPRLPVGHELQLYHRGAQNVGGAHEAEGNLRGELFAFLKSQRAKIL